MLSRRPALGQRPWPHVGELQDPRESRCVWTKRLAKVGAGLWGGGQAPKPPAGRGCPVPTHRRRGTAPDLWSIAISVPLHALPGAAASVSRPARVRGEGKAELNQRRGPAIGSGPTKLGPRGRGHRLP